MDQGAHLNQLNQESGNGADAKKFNLANDKRDESVKFESSSDYPSDRFLDPQDRSQMREAQNKMQGHEYSPQHSAQTREMPANVKAAHLAQVIQHDKTQRQDHVAQSNHSPVRKAQQAPAKALPNNPVRRAKK